MAAQKIEFRKTRDFGENLNDTFLFIRLNFKPLFNSFFAICGLFMLVLAVFKGVFQSSLTGIIWQGMFKGKTTIARNMEQMYSFQNLMAVLLVMLTFISMQVSVGAYVKYYVDNNGKKPGIEEVWTIFRKYFFRIFRYNIVTCVAVTFGCLLCLVPGIYLSVVFIPISLVAMMEDTNFITSYHRCFALIKENFWISFSIYFIVFFISYISWLITGALISLVFNLSGYVTANDMESTTNMVKSFFNIFSFCFYILFLVSVAFHYFNLVEIKDGTGILSRINNIGKHNKDLDSIEEQY
ncbi:MAG: hypothetical protein ABIN89_11490 [Chitinophagaceae bacterium]